MNSTIRSDPNELTVEKIMQKDFICINRHKSIYDAASLMSKAKVGMLPVVDEDGVTLIGIITDRDIVLRAVSEKKDLSKTEVRECMTENPCRVVPSMSCSDAMFMMSRCKVRRVAVVKSHKLVGVLSTSDIAQTFSFCPNTRCSQEDCILINVGEGLKHTSYLQTQITND